MKRTTIRLAKIISTALFLAIIILGARSVSAADIPIDAKNFPDENFREVVGFYDKDEDKILSSKEIEQVTKIEYHDFNNEAYVKIKSYKGIENFSNLKEIYMELIEASIDLSKNKNLEDIDLGGDAKSVILGDLPKVFENILF